MGITKAESQNARRRQRVFWCVAKIPVLLI